MKSIIYFLFLFAMALTSCSTSYKIVSDPYPVETFASFNTYYLENEPLAFPKGGSPVHKQLINDALHSEMKLQGYQLSQSADLAIYWRVVIDEVTTERVHHTYAKWGYEPHTHMISYKEGTLVVDVIEAKTERVLWHGKTTQRVMEETTEIETKIKEAVNAMMEQFKKDMNPSASTTKN